MVQETEPRDELRSGDVFAGRYRIEKLLGEGDRKRTYLAEDVLVEHRMVAVSVVRADAVQLDPYGTSREANLLSRVGSHSHIVTLYDRSVPESPVEYLVFEYLPGGTLAELIEQAGAQAQRLSPDLVVRFGRQLAGALAHIHAAGLVHRDVAPHNIWLTSQGSKDKVKLGDFDSAVVLKQIPEHPPVTSDGFASPEESPGGGELDQRSDLYSLGGTLVSLARGECRFDEPEALYDTRPDFPPTLTELLVSLVAHDPDARPGSAEEVLTRLREIDESLDLYSVIAAGEGPDVEFKASMLFPHEKPQLPATSTEEQLAAALAGMPAKLEQAVVKSIAAFLNSHGGTLLVGVADNGIILGIEADFPLLSEKVGYDVDGWQRHLNSIVTSRLDGDVWIALQLTLHRTERGTVARIHCPPRTQPTWYTFEGKQEFYVRGPAASDPLPAPLWSQYIKERWLS